MRNDSHLPLLLPRQVAVAEAKGEKSFFLREQKELFRLINYREEIQSHKSTNPSEKNCFLKWRESGGFVIMEAELRDSRTTGTDAEQKNFSAVGVGGVGRRHISISSSCHASGNRNRLETTKFLLTFQPQPRLADC
jgi:hypothetical protein